MQFATSSVSANFFSQWMTARNKTEKKNKSVICSTTLLFATSPKTRLYTRCTVYSFANTCYYYFFLSDDSYIVMVNVRILLQTIISNLKKKKEEKSTYARKRRREREREEGDWPVDTSPSESRFQLPIQGPVGDLNTKPIHIVSLSLCNPHTHTHTQGRQSRTCITTPGWWIYTRLYILHYTLVV